MNYQAMKKKKGKKKLKPILLSEKSQSEKSTVWVQLYDILEKAKLWDSKKISGGQGLMGGKNKLAQHRGFPGHWKYSMIL